LLSGSVYNPEIEVPVQTMAIVGCKILLAVIRHLTLEIVPLIAQHLKLSQFTCASRIYRPQYIG
jgi:hypothetical protein